MKNNKAAGFTLVECIVAIAVLSIGTLVMASIYGCIAQINEKTFRANESLSKTIERVEMQSDKGVDPGATKPQYAMVKGSDGNNSTKITFELKNSTKSYTMQTNVYVIFSEDSDSHKSGGSNVYYEDPSTDPIELRYKYFSTST